MHRLTDVAGTKMPYLLESVGWTTVQLLKRQHSTCYTTTSHPCKRWFPQNSYTLEFERLQDWNWCSPQSQNAAASMVGKADLGTKKQTNKLPEGKWLEWKNKTQNCLKGNGWNEKTKHKIAWREMAGMKKQNTKLPEGKWLEWKNKTQNWLKGNGCIHHHHPTMGEPQDFSSGMLTSRQRTLAVTWTREKAVSFPPGHTRGSGFLISSTKYSRYYCCVSGWWCWQEEAGTANGKPVWRRNI